MREMLVGVSPLAPDPLQGRVWPRPRVGYLIGLRSQPSIVGPSTAWTQNGDGLTRQVDVDYQLADGIDAGRRLDCSIRTQLVPDTTPLHAWSWQHAEEFAHDPLGLPTDWVPIVVTVNGLRVHAQQAIAGGWKLISLTYNDRFVSVVTSVLDAERFQPDYAVFQPWPDDAPGVYDPRNAPPPRLRQASHQHNLSAEVTPDEA